MAFQDEPAAPSPHLPELDRLEFFLRIDEPRNEGVHLFSELINGFAQDVLRKQSSFL